MEKYLIILAGGKGERMSDKLPKQFMDINGRPLLMHTFDTFSGIMPSLHILLVLNRHFFDPWQKLCDKHHFTTPHHIVEGGPKRYYSVKSGLATVPPDSLVAVHDGVRPFVSAKVIESGFKIAHKKGNAVPVIPVTESLREVSGSLNKPVDRNRFVTVQTPQFFYTSSIQKAYRKTYDEKFTDDAMVLEASGQQIYLFQGDNNNIKITTPEDLEFAEYMLREKYR